MKPMQLAVAVFMAIVAPQALLACDTGPDYCTDDPRIPKLLADKKALLLKEYPADFVKLLDIGAQCVARINQSPDGFTLMTVGKDGAIDASTWDVDNQRAANGQITDGFLKEYWIYNARIAFKCSGDPNYVDRPDYDGVLDLNTSFSIRCNTPTSCPIK